MNFIARLFQPAPSKAAAQLGSLGGRATARKAREKVHAKARQMCREMGRPVPDVLRAR